MINRECRSALPDTPPFCPRTSADLPGLRFNKILIMTGTGWLVAASLFTLELRMEFFQLHHPKCDCVM